MTLRFDIFVGGFPATMLLETSSSFVMDDAKRTADSLAMLDDELTCYVSVVSSTWLYPVGTYSIDVAFQPAP